MQYLRLILITLLLTAALPVLAANWNVDQGGTFTRGTGAMIKGYDPVAYFTEGKPVKGSAEYAHEYDGHTFWFASEEHRRLFVADPEKYAPQYGGYCAWAVAQGELADIDPNAWAIHDGRLYLNYNANIQSRWEADIPGHIVRADANWPQLNN